MAKNKSMEGKNCILLLYRDSRIIINFVICEDIFCGVVDNKCASFYNAS
jgi:hypothetical protein